MANGQPQKKSCLRALWRVFVFLLLFVLVNAAVFGVVAWNKRIEWVSHILSKELDKQGLSDVVFEIGSLSPKCLVLENVRVGEKDAPLLVVRWVEARFSFPEILSGEFDRIRVRGVDLPVDIDEGRVSVPLVERLNPFLESELVDRIEARAELLDFKVGEASAYDVRLLLRKDGKPLLTLETEVVAVLSPKWKDDHYGFRMGITVTPEGRDACQLALNGTVGFETGEVAVTGEMNVRHVESFVGLAQEMLPQEMTQLPVAVSNCNASVRIAASAIAWTNVEQFKVTAELERGSVLTLPEHDTEVTLQSLRVDAASALGMEEIECRVNVGISGVRSQGKVQVSQEEGRLLSVRGTARYAESDTNRILRATVDTDLAGRVAAKILPDLLPLMPRLLTDGGTFHAETMLMQEAGKLWKGEARFLAEARRTSVTLPSGRFAASRAAVDGRVEIRDNQLGDVQTEVLIEDGMYSSQGNSARANFHMALALPPPYQTAQGTFEGRISANNWLDRLGMRLVETNGVSFVGQATLKDLMSAPEWLVALSIPAVGVASTSNDWHSTVGGAADIRYSATEAAVTAMAWAEDVQWSLPMGSASAGVERASVAIALPPFNPEDVSNAVAKVTVDVSNGWGRAGDMFSVENLRVKIPFTWSLAESIAFPESPELAWERMTLDSLDIETTAFALVAADGTLDIRTGVRCAGSVLNIQALALVPLDNPNQLTVGLEIPDMTLDSEDSLAARIRKIDSETHVTGSLKVRADLRLLGSQPYVLGRLDVTDGHLVRGELDVSGIKMHVPFELGVEARTVERPFVSFDAMKVGEVRLANGRVDFQVTPKEVFFDRLEADFCKGKLYAYSVHLDPQNPTADVTVYADRIDLGEMLASSLPFKADQVEGVLFGRFPLKIDNGQIRLKPGYLYSLPGQGGKFRVNDSRLLEPWLAQAGIQEDVRAPLAEALSLMDFNVIRMELETDEAEDTATLRLGLSGKSNSKDWPAPVDLKLNVSGPLDMVLNMGLKLSQKKGEIR